MDGYSGPGGWSNIGMNPFEVVQERLRKAAKRSKKSAAPAEDTQQAERPKEWSPFSRAVESNRIHAARTQSNAEATQRFVARTVGADRPWGVDSKRPVGAPSEPRQFSKAPTVLKPGQPEQSQYEPAPVKPAAARRITPGRGPR